MSDFYQAGYSIGRYKEVPPENPYARDSNAWRDWQKGYEAGVRDRVALL